MYNSEEAVSENSISNAAKTTVTETFSDNVIEKLSEAYEQKNTIVFEANKKVYCIAPYKASNYTREDACYVVLVVEQVGMLRQHTIVMDTILATSICVLPSKNLKLIIRFSLGESLSIACEIAIV